MPKGAKFEEGVYFVTGPLTTGNVVPISQQSKEEKETLAEKRERLRDEERMASEDQEIDLKRKARMTQLRKDIKEMQQEMEGDDEKSEEGKDRKGTALAVKHYDIVRGQLIRNDETGEHTLDEAIKLLKLEKPSGDDSAMGTLLKALVDALKPGDQFKVTDLLARFDTMAEKMGGGGVDPENLALTLENRELKLRQELTGQLNGFLEKIKESLKPKTNEDEGSPFTMGEDGQITIARGARLSMNQILAYQMTNRPQGRGIGISDRDGNVIPMDSIDGVLKIKTWDREQRREDDRVQIQKDAVRLVREHAPDVIDAVRNLGGPGGKTKEVMEKSGWGKRQPGGAQGGETVRQEQSAPPPDLVEVPGGCAKCHAPHKVSPNSKMFKCANPACGVNNWLGSKEELKEQMKVWEIILGSEESSAGSPEGSPKEKSEGPSSPT